MTTCRMHNRAAEKSTFCLEVSSECVQSPPPQPPPPPPQLAVSGFDDRSHRPPQSMQTFSLLQPCLQCARRAPAAHRPEKSRPGLKAKAIAAVQSKFKYHMMHRRGGPAQPEVGKSLAISMLYTACMHFIVDFLCLSLASSSTKALHKCSQVLLGATGSRSWGRRPCSRSSKSDALGRANWAPACHPRRHHRRHRRPPPPAKCWSDGTRTSRRWWSRSCSVSPCSSTRIPRPRTLGPRCGMLR